MNESDKILLEIDLGRTKESAQEASKALDTVATSIHKVKDSYDLLEKETKEYALATDKADAAMDRQVKTAYEATQAQNAIRRALAESVTVIDTTIGTPGSKGAAGRGMLGISYAIQDFTSQVQNGFLPAIASVQNNIPQIVMGFGMDAGLAGAISVAAVGLGVALPLIANLAGGTKKSGEEADAATRKLYGFNEQLEKLLELGKKLHEEPTAVETAAKKALGAAVDAAGRRTIEGGIEAHLREVDIGREEDDIDIELKRQGNERSFFSAEAWQSLRDQVRPKVRAAAAGQRANRRDIIMASLDKGDESTRQMVENLARARPDQFGAMTADILAKASPAGRKAEAESRASIAMNQLGTEVDIEALEQLHMFPDTPPAFLGGRLPVGRIDQGPLAAGARAAVETPAQRRARVNAALAARPRPNVIGPQGEPEFQSQNYAPTYRPRRSQARALHDREVAKMGQAAVDATATGLLANKETQAAIAKTRADLIRLTAIAAKQLEDAKKLGSKMGRAKQ